VVQVLPGPHSLNKNIINTIEIKKRDQHGSNPRPLGVKELANPLQHKCNI